MKLVYENFYNHESTFIRINLLHHVLSNDIILYSEVLFYFKQKNSNKYDMLIL